MPPLGVDLERRSQEDSIGMMRRMSVFVSKSGHVNYGSQCPKMALGRAPKVPPAVVGDALVSIVPGLGRRRYLSG
jgi:hypothetical protein